ncbi:MAG TPA: LD-carboxypeptidase [Bacilli bacterium]|nr:LD-carboxypeptidase [Bacilli bacterium]
MKKIRVVALSRSMKIVCSENIELAKNNLTAMGYQLDFAKSCNVCDAFYSSSVFSRKKDLEAAFNDKNVDIILAAIGGYNVNQILDGLNYNMIKKNPKPICGYSDITVLLNAIYAKTGMITYLGPNFQSFAMKKGLTDTLFYFQKAMNKEAYYLKDPEYYSSDRWYDNQEARIFIKNKGCYVINEGYAEGIIVGGNLCSFNLLQGTDYLPDLENKILFIEDDELVGSEFAYEFDRNLVSLMSQKGFAKVKGLVIGRAQTATKMNLKKWQKILNKKVLKQIPVIVNANFGHTTPNATIPIGGRCIINTALNKEQMIYITFD